MKAIGYIRVSTEEQANEGVSLAAQEAKIRAYCELHDMELVGVLGDAGLSGKHTKRPQLQEVLRRVEAHEVQAVVVYKLDRLSRRAVDTLTMVEAIEKAGAAFHSIQEKVDTKSAMGRFFLTITAAFAQMERDMIGERTSEALRYKLAQGEHVGRTPFGFRIDGKRLAEIHEQAHVIEAILAWRESGMSLRAIAAELNAQGYPTQRGGTWRPQTVKNIIERATA